ncbi:hypothetical protein ACQKWADRAFT_113320 [Trichoderma austrokoningii]
MTRAQIHLTCSSLVLSHASILPLPTIQGGIPGSQLGKQTDAPDILAKSTSRRDTTSKGASILAKGPIRALPFILLPTIYAYLVVGLHKRTALVGSLECEKEKIPLPCGPCMHCHVDDGNGNVLSSFCIAHARNIVNQVTTIRTSWGGNAEHPKSFEKKKSFSGINGGGGSWFDPLLPALHISSHRHKPRDTVMASHISLTLGFAGGLCNVSRQTSNAPICISSASSDLVSSAMCHG